MKYASMPRSPSTREPCTGSMTRSIALPFGKLFFLRGIREYGDTPTCADVPTFAGRTYHSDTFSHPDCNCRLRNLTGSAGAIWRPLAGFHRRWGLSPRPEGCLSAYIIALIGALSTAEGAAEAVCRLDFTQVVGRADTVNGDRLVSVSGAHDGLSQATFRERGRIRFAGCRSFSLQVARKRAVGTHKRRDGDANLRSKDLHPAKLADRSGEREPKTSPS